MDAETVGSSHDNLKKKEHELRDVDDKISDLNEESARLSKQSDSRAKLSLKRTEKEVKETTVNRMWDWLTFMGCLYIHTNCVWF